MPLLAGRGSISSSILILSSKIAKISLQVLDGQDSFWGHLLVFLPVAVLLFHLHQLLVGQRFLVDVQELLHIIHVHLGQPNVLLQLDDVLVEVGCCRGTIHRHRRSLLPHLTDNVYRLLDVVLVSRLESNCFIVQNW